MLSEQVRPAGTPGAESDADLIELSLREPAQFGAIFDRHAAEILRYAHARLGPSLAEEVIAETSLAAFRRRDNHAPRPGSEMDLDDFDRMQRANVRGTFVVS